MTEPLPGPDELIDKAARVIYEGFFATQPLRYVPWDQAEESIKDNNRLRACALADAGLLADPGLQAELERWKNAYQAKLGDFAAETLRTSRALRACTVTPINKHVPQVVVGEALLGWRGAQEHIRAEITRDLDPEDVDARADLLTEVGLLRAERHVLAAERDQLQARIVAALAVLDEPVPHLRRADPGLMGMNARRNQEQLVQRLRAALQGDQPEVSGG